MAMSKYRRLEAIESTVIQMLSEGKGASQIGDILGYSSDTAETYIYRIRQKYNAKNTPHLISIAYQKGILRIDSLNCFVIT